ncbi:MAG: hypothetical protein K6B28_06785 [Lachnospiraceae bacterium]|nr:hypothetical protein [Lachnospiraceae bacterium]
MSRNTDKVKFTGRFKSVKIWLLIVSVAIFAVLVILYSKRYIIPFWADFMEKTDKKDIGRICYDIILKDKRLRIRNEEGSEYVSDEEYKVSDYLISDIDKDGKEELIVLFWKRGSYGPYRPFWVEEDENNYSQHIGVYEFGFDNSEVINERYLALNTGDKSGKRVISQKWVSSDTGLDIVGINADEDGILSLLLKDGSVRRYFYGKFGFILLDE